MGLFRKKDKVIDLTEHYAKQQEKAEEVSEGGSSDAPVNIFGGVFGGGQQTEATGFEETVNPEERRRRLAKRLKEMTEKIENLSNQIYHLEQRLEVVERKTNTGSY